MITAASVYRQLGRDAALAINARHGIDYANAARQYRQLRDAEAPEDRGRAEIEFETGIRTITRKEPTP